MNKKIDTRITNIMVMSNGLIKAVYDGNMSINAMKLFRTVIAQCRMNDSEFYEYECTVKELAKLFQVDASRVRHEAEISTNQCLRVRLEISDKDGNFDKINVFSRARYVNGMFTIKLNDDMKPLLLKLKKDFTKIPLGHVLHMKSKYSIRIYELIMEEIRNAPIFADNHKKVEITLELLRKITDNQKTLKQIGQFKDRCLNVAINEINNSDIGIHIDVEDVKQGRTIIAFKFDVWSQVGWEYCKNIEYLEIM